MLSRGKLSVHEEFPNLVAETRANGAKIYRAAEPVCLEQANFQMGHCDL
jgi:hypothetical protein